MQSLYPKAPGKHRFLLTFILPMLGTCFALIHLNRYSLPTPLLILLGDTMKKILIGLSIIPVVLIAGIAIIPSLVPSSVYKDRIQTQLSKELARDVTIEGDVTLSVFPTIRAKTDRVVIANPESFTATDFASMDGLEARIKLLPLLSKRVEISAFTLKNPVINLEKRADGQANWIMGDKTTDGTEKAPVDDGPFKRDGRYANIDPTIGLFSIDNGSISYSDATTDTQYILTKANLEFSLPGLAKPVSIKGDVIVNDEPLDITLSLDTPRAFLNGEETPVSFDIVTNFADISGQGVFLESQDIAVSLNIQGGISDVSALSAYMPIDTPIGDLAKTIKLSGTYTYDGSVLSAKDAHIRASGDNVNLTFKGDARLAESPVLDGTVDLNLTDITTLASILKLDMPGLDIAKTLSLTADMNAAGKGFAAKNIKAKVTGDDVEAEFFGTATYGDIITADGDVSANTGSIPALVRALKLNMPQAAALGRADFKGKLSMDGDTITLVLSDAKTSSEHLDAIYIGSVIKNGETISLDGNFDGTIKSLQRLAEVAAMDVPYAASIGSVTAKGSLSGPVDALSISGLDASLADGQLNGRFEGSATMKDSMSLTGKLSADIPSVRALAAAIGTALLPSTDAGNIYEAFAISGQVKGSPEALSFDGATIAFDNINGRGSFAVDLKQAKPFVTGQIDLDGLDLRPYMASYAQQNPTGDIQPWSEEPLNVAMLNAVDGDFKFSTPNIITDRLKMGQADVNAALRNGKVTAELPKVNAYGGLGNLTATLDASSAVPTFALDVSMDDLNSNAFLGAVAGFTQATGEGKTGLSIRGSGTSQAAIMKSLDGQGDFKIIDGQLSGIDLTQFLTGLDQALTSKSLPGGIGSQYATQFNDIVGLFKIENGIAKIDKFSLSGFGVAAEGAGKIDLGSQNIDFSLRPRLTGKSASDLASFGIPVRIKGGFGSASAGLDTELLGKIAAAQAKARLQKELTDQVGGPVGSILGGILGGGQTRNNDQTSQNPVTNNQTQAETPPKPAAIKPEDAVNDLLGNLFGKPKKKEDEEKKE